MTVFEPTLSSEKLREATGRDWKSWLNLLDEVGAEKRTHTEIVRWLVDEQGIAGWWAQSITVGYERARGLRDPGHRIEDWSANISKAFDTPVETLFGAFEKDSIRDQWLPDAQLRLRAATAPVSAEYDWGEGPTRLTVGFERVGPSKSKINLEHGLLPDREVAERMKAWWRERLNELKELLEEA